MNNILTKTLTAIFFVGFLAGNISAQKFAHLNSQLLITEMPSIKTANATLDTYQSDLVATGQDMVKAFEAEYNQYVETANGGTLSKLEMQQKENQLGAKQQEIQKYELEVQQKLMAKKEELYKPILDQIKVAIQSVGAEGNYTMIFDTSTGALVFAEESENIMAKVKVKLGI